MTKLFTPNSGDLTRMIANAEAKLDGQRRAGRPPGPEGTQRRYTIMLSPVQVRRALTLGTTISKGVNTALRELVPEVPPLTIKGE